MAALAAMLVIVACGGGDDPAPEPDDGGDTEAPEPDDEGEDDAGDDDSTDGDDAAAGDFDPETYFEGKTIRFVTSSGAGGGTDTKARTLASQLPRFIPGNPATQVSNVTPHVAGINFLWGAEPDGLTVGLTAAPTLEFEFFEGASWDSTQFNFIGAMDATCDNMLLIRGDVGYDSIDDAIGSDGPPLITMDAAPTPADVEPVALSTMLIAEYLDLPLEVRRVAESGTSALNLALERGDINFARYGSDWCRIPSANPGWLEDGFVIPFLDVGTSGPADMAEGVEERGDRPAHISELITEDEYQQWLGLVAASRAGGNTFFLPPGTPTEIVEAWRDIFLTAFEDEDFAENVTVAFGGSDIRVFSGQETQDLITQNKAAMEEYADEATEITERLVEKYFN